MTNISRRKFIVDMGKGISFVSLSPFLTSSKIISEDELPNIIVIFIDDMGYADVGPFGAKGYKTPNVDKLANDGIIFTDFHAATAVCSASRAALLTGCYSERVSIRGALNHTALIGLNPEEENIARILKRKNYKTAIVGKWHLGHHEVFLPLQQGFDEFYGLPYSNDMWPVGYDGKPISDNWKANYPVLKIIEGNQQTESIEDLEDQSTLTTRYTEKAVDFIQRNANNKFFLYLAHSMPHVPIAVSEKFKGKSENGLFGDVIMEIDWSVGEIVKALEKNNIDENTLIIFTSDNGPWLNFGNHAGSAFPLREGKGTMWEGGNRVPCIMKWPKNIKSHSKCDKLTSTIDILPTISEITHSKLPKNKIDGVNIFPLMLNEDVNPRDEFWYYYDYDLIAVRKNYWKLYFPCVQRSYEGMIPGKDGFPGPTWQKEIGYELYNLKDDIGEKNNVINEHPEIVEKLKKIGDKARYELGDRLTGIKGKENRDPGRIGKNRIKFEEHLAIGKNLELKSLPHKRYALGNTSILNDGWTGSFDYNDGYWLGFEGNDVEFIIDLADQIKINKIQLSFLQSQNSWIFLPKKIQISISDDGLNYSSIYDNTFEIKPDLNVGGIDFATDSIGMKCRFIKVYAENIKDCPNWHIGKGEKAWLFMDEIIVK